MRALETSLSRTNPRRICVGKDSENEIAGPGDHLKHRFLELTHFAFCAGQLAESMFKEPCEL